MLTHPLLPKLRQLRLSGMLTTLEQRATQATDQLETLIALPYDSIVADEVTDGAYKVTWDVDNDTPLPKTKTITVTVEWLHRGPRSFTVTYIKSNNL